MLSPANMTVSIFINHLPESVEQDLPFPDFLIPSPTLLPIGPEVAGWYPGKIPDHSVL
jgi:hypothetical protein